MHAEINTIHRRSSPDRVQKLARNPFPRRFGQSTARRDKKRTERGNNFDPCRRIKDGQRTADLVADCAVIINQLTPTPDSKIFVSAEMRIKSGDFLFTFGDEDSRHGVFDSDEQWYSEYVQKLCREKSMACTLSWPMFSRI